MPRGDITALERLIHDNRFRLKHSSNVGTELIAQEFIRAINGYFLMAYKKDSGLYGDRFHGVQYAMSQLEAAAVQADTATASTPEGTDFLLTILEECMYNGLNDVNHKSVLYVLYRLRNAEQAALAGSQRSSRIKVDT